MDIEDSLLVEDARDVVIIGAGAIGASIARELSKYQDLSVLVCEKEADVTQGASKANSGIVHGGYDAKHGTLKGRFEHEGNSMFGDVCAQLAVPFKRIGSLVLSFTKRDDLQLEKLLENGTRNGVPGLELWERDRILKEEPHVSVGVRRALYCPNAGIVNPYLYTIANCESAIENGVEFQLNQKVLSVSKERDGLELLVEHTRSKKTTRIKARQVINCAGLYSDSFSSEFTIKPRRGEYFILRKEQGQMANRVLFQAPTERWGKGILVSPTVDGNLLIGPSAADVMDRLDKGTSFQELGYVAWAARRSVPHLDTRMAIRSFAGIRSKSSTGDFVIKEDVETGIIQVAGIDSPGLTSSPAIARHVVNTLVRPQKPLKQDWISKRRPYDSASALHAKHELRFEHASEPEKNVICRCENVTESTIKDCLHRGLPIEASDSVKWRCRAGMGFCGGVRCRPLVCEIMGKELGLDAAAIPKAVPGQEATQRLVKQELGRL